MKITEAQLLFLFHLLIDSLKKNVVGHLSTTHEARNKLLNDIINQQDNTTLYDIKISEEGK